MKFGQAIELLKQGKRIARKGWNGKGMFLLYVPAEKWGIIDKIGLGIPKGNLSPWIGMKTADGKFVPWLASQTDILAEDWEMVKANKMEAIGEGLTNAANTRKESDNDDDNR